LSIYPPDVSRKDENDLALYIVVFCKPAQSKLIRQILSTDLVRQACQSFGQSAPKVVIVEAAPRPRSGYRGGTHGHCEQLTTFCGTPILLVNKFAEEQAADERPRATFGGVIKITTPDGSSQMYGMTGGHAATPSIWCDNAPPGERADDHTMQYKILFEAMDGTDGENIGEVLDYSILPGFVDHHRQPSHDWALFTLKSSKPNKLYADTTYPGHWEEREVLVASRPTFHDDLSDPVIVMGASLGPTRGELSNLPSRILIGGSEVFVDAFMLKMDAVNGEEFLWLMKTSNRRLTRIFQQYAMGIPGRGLYTTHRPNYTGMSSQRTFLGTHM
jgi:hypothetical protein